MAITRGELVSVTINSARVIETRVDDGRTIVELEIYGKMWSLPADGTSIEIRHHRPPEWPPQQGDVWLDPEGSAWFAGSFAPGPDDGGDVDESGWRIVFHSDMTSHDDDTRNLALDYVFDEHGPLTLAFRREETA